MTTAAISCRDVTKHYGGVPVVDGISFDVRPGEIFGIIGPNGAGKTTLVECLEGLRVRDDGAVQILGLDPDQHSQEVRQRTGVQLQSAALPGQIRVGEAMELFAAFYPAPVDNRSLLARLGLEQQIDSYVDKLSGGQRQRVFIALALINAPELVFLDELTTGLDPQARLAIWDVIRGIRDDGTTVMLTTHFMEEAEQLCDRVAIVDDGQLIALDTVPGLVTKLQDERTVSFTPTGEPPVNALRSIADVTAVEQRGNHVTVHGRGTRFPAEVFEVLSAADLWARDLRSDEPSLEDVFLALTGRAMREEQPA